MTILIKLTQDGRRVEVIGTAICLGGRLEALDLVEVAKHPHRAAIRRAAPDATHMAGRIALTREEAETVVAAQAAAEAAILSDPLAISERFRIALRQQACEQGIE